jgi:DNA processing protein
MILPLIPERLTKIASAPKALYYEGDTTLLDRPLVAIVGTRRPSNYTKTWTQRVAKAVSEAGGVVVSGGAMGVDAIAHEAAFPNTIAILAGSIERGYIRLNKNLIDRLRQNALVLSEYESEMEPKGWMFVHRNRLVTGISQAVCVMEADPHSGSMTSANLAIKQGRKLFVLPHELGSSDGTNKLCEERLADMIWSEETLLKELGLNGAAAESDELLDFCSNRPTYDEFFERFGAKAYEYELSGRIVVKGGFVERG